MPELPEVETVRQAIEASIRGQQIQRVKLTLSRILLDCSPAKFSTILAGQTIQEVLRRGKYLILQLDKDSVIFHLGMTGQLTFAPAGSKITSGFQTTLTGLKVSTGVHPADKHTHLVIRFKSGDRLLFRDVRTFGKIIYVAGNFWKEHPRIKKLGYEPLEIKARDFIRKHYPFKNTRSIKSLLLDQSTICGLGNIYCDEACYKAGIHPAKPVNRLSETEWKRLLKASKYVLRQGLKNFGTTLSDYRRPDGSKGENQESLKVYGRAGKACTACGHMLEKCVIAQRTTVFCEKCQSI